MHAVEIRSKLAKGLTHEQSHSCAGKVPEDHQQEELCVLKVIYFHCYDTCDMLIVMTSMCYVGRLYR